MTGTTTRAGAIDRRLAVAPMMDHTDRHCRYLLRLIAPRALLYTEMVPTGALLRGDPSRALAHHPRESPLALQLGGAEPAEMAASAALAAEAGFDEVNVNVGCPSDRVREGRFGACLMAEPGRVAACVARMRDASALPVTVKTRTGIDEHDSYDFLRRFVEAVAGAGAAAIIVHARKAWLKGLSPKENREVPPLAYDTVYRLKRDFPALPVVLNGGIGNAAEARAHLAQVDGVMIGREAYRNPMLLAELEAAILGPVSRPLSREAVVAAFLPYLRAELARGTPLVAMTRHLLGLFQGVPGARAFRRHISEHAHRPGAGAEVPEDALALVRAPLAA